MMQAPTHLAKCTVPLDKKEIKGFGRRLSSDDQDQFVGRVKCPCGGHSFEILSTAQEKSGPSVAKIDGEFYFIIKSRCTKCQEEHILFDDHFHGWNGWICHEPEKAALPRPSLMRWNCKKCGDSHHTITLIINSQGEEDFIEEAGEEYDSSRWQDAFDWFTMDIECKTCGKETKDFVSYETM